MDGRTQRRESALDRANAAFFDEVCGMVDGTIPRKDDKWAAYVARIRESKREIALEDAASLDRRIAADLASGRLKLVDYPWCRCGQCG